MLYSHTLERAVRHFPDHMALVSASKRLTFRQLHQRVAGIAAALHRHGFRSGHRLAILLPNEPDYLELMYACAWLGVVIIPLNIRLSEVEIDHILSDSTPRGLIRHSSLPAPSASLSWQLVLDQQPLKAVGGDIPEIVYDPEAILALLYTSGTTGRPKGAVLTHANILADIHHFNYWLPYEEAGVFLHAAPIFHIIDLPFLFATPIFGACQTTIPKFAPRDFCETVERERVTHTVLAPTMINFLVQFPELNRFNLTSLKYLGYGGSPMAPELVAQIRSALPKVDLVQGYGLTETGFITGLKNDEHSMERLLSCGRPSPGIDLRIVDDSGQEVAVGVHGELIARGASVMRHYWNNPPDSGKAFCDGMFRTGDIGYRDAEGFIYILDRRKDMIVTGGENVYSGEVEAVIYAHPGVREVAVFGIPDSQWGELVMACVVPKPGIKLEADELAAHCRRFLATYKVPRRVEFSKSDLPKSGSGKILKRLLREPFWVQQQRAVA